MTEPSCTCGGGSFDGVTFHWDHCDIMRPNEPRGYIISEHAADNIRAFAAKHGRMPSGTTETLAAMLRGADADV